MKREAPAKMGREGGRKRKSSFLSLIDCDKGGFFPLSLSPSLREWRIRDFHPSLSNAAERRRPEEGAGGRGDGANLGVKRGKISRGSFESAFYVLLCLLNPPKEK